MSVLFSVVIPVYNGENSLEELYLQIKLSLEKITDQFEIIMVDDSSQDKSYSKIIELSRRDKRIKGIKLAQNFGQQNAIICGFNYVNGDFIITMDDDLQHEPKDIIKLYRKIREGYDAVYAIPEDREYTFYRRLGSKLTNYLFDLITDKNSRIRVSSFRIMNRDLVNKITAEKSSFVYISAILLKYTDKIANIFVSHSERKYGDSNYNIFKLTSLFLKLYIYYGNLSFLQYFRRDKDQYIIEETTYNIK